MNQVADVSESIEVMEGKKRTIITGEELQKICSWTDWESRNVFGIESQILVSEGAEEDFQYQMIVLYDMNFLDDMIAKHCTVDSARFLITSQQGTVLYDNFASDTGASQTHFEELVKIIV